MPGSVDETAERARGPGALGNDVVRAVPDVDRVAAAFGGGPDPHPARRLAHLRSEPGPLVAPQARALGELVRLPPVDVDPPAAPAELEHER
ncbi:hypothetical protein SDC9_69034 [bioreactor metagenome]|uniref:Uncharacterized protein n=1 Tax=bioreactor metagenome TaxID=1076179 RepID=A0A644Y357_9ZZZZ